MIYTLSNEFITVNFNTLGAEIVSLKRIGSDTEYIWVGDPKYWNGQAPVLFPICGRLWDGKYYYKDKEYEMKTHGFARRSEFSVIAQTTDSISFELCDSDETRAMYPFRFSFIIKYTLDKNRIITEYTTENRGVREMLFAVGAHPGFNVPLGGEGDFEDWRLVFAERRYDVRKFVLSPACFLTHNTAPFELEDGNIIHLNHSLFDDDAFFLIGAVRDVSLVSDKSKHGVRMTFEDMRYVGFWHAPHTDAPYVCIEPWCGTPDYDGETGNLEKKRDMLHLPSAQTLTRFYTIEIF